VSASNGNLGNVIVASNTDLFIIQQNLEMMHKIDAVVGFIVSTFIEKNNQLWIGS
jgi:hypothetical protein